jgi:putative transposase
MSRQSRPVVPEIPLHITQRGNNRLRCFFSDSDFMVYLDLLGIAARRTACQIHAYVLMTNHIHLLLTPTDEQGPAAMMKSLGERYVKYVNRRYSRTGTLWEGRYRSCLVQSERYLMVCQRYIELNPVRAKLVNDPFHYPWSSYLRNAHGKECGLVTPHELYSRLGNDKASRESSYRELFSEILTEDTLDQLRRATHRSLAFGNRAFADQMAKQLWPIAGIQGSDPKSDPRSDPGSDPGFWCSIANDQK